jgi:hypothetical protein
MIKFKRDSLIEESVSLERHSACGGSLERHASAPPQCDPRGAFCSIGNFVSIEQKKRLLPLNSDKSLVLISVCIPIPQNAECDDVIHNTY